MFAGGNTPAVPPSPPKVIIRQNADDAHARDAQDAANKSFLEYAWDANARVLTDEYAGIVDRAAAFGKLFTLATGSILLSPLMLTGCSPATPQVDQRKTNILHAVFGVFLPRGENAVDGIPYANLRFVPGANTDRPSAGPFANGAFYYVNNEGALIQCSPEQQRKLLLKLHGWIGQWPSGLVEAMEPFATAIAAMRAPKTGEKNTFDLEKVQTGLQNAAAYVVRYASGVSPANPVQLDDRVLDALGETADADEWNAFAEANVANVALQRINARVQTQALAAALGVSMFESDNPKLLAAQTKVPALKTLNETLNTAINDPTPKNITAVLSAAAAAAGDDGQKKLLDKITTYLKRISDSLARINDPGLNNNNTPTASARCSAQAELCSPHAIIGNALSLLYRIATAETPPPADADPEVDGDADAVDADEAPEAEEAADAGDADEATEAEEAADAGDTDTADRAEREGTKTLPPCTGNPAQKNAKRKAGQCK